MGILEITAMHAVNRNNLFLGNCRMQKDKNYGRHYP